MHQCQQPQASLHRLWSCAGGDAALIFPGTEGGHEVQLEVSKGGELRRPSDVLLCF